MFVYSEFWTLLFAFINCVQQQQQQNSRKFSVLISNVSLESREFQKLSGLRKTLVLKEETIDLNQDRTRSCTVKKEKRYLLKN